MAGINYINQEGKSGTLELHDLWLFNDPQAVAQLIAEKEIKDPKLKLKSILNWPRDYKIPWEPHRKPDQWVTVSVDMDYEPSFTATIKESTN